MTHNQTASNLDGKFKIGLILNTSFTIFELIVGILSGSLALVSDAGHNFTDSLNLLIAFMAERFGQKKADVRHSYGHERATIIAALFNALVLLFLAFYIFFEAAKRIVKPEPVSGGLVMIVALVGIIINGSIAFLFSQDKDLHIRSAFLSMAFDTLASLGALLAGVIIYFTHKTIADPIASIVIGILLIVSAWEVLEDSLHVLLEGVPKGIDIKKVEACIKETEHVKEMDDLHVWSLSSRDVALSCHIILDECNLIKSTNIVKNIKQNLQKQFDIYHATIEVELTGCNPIK